MTPQQVSHKAGFRTALLGRASVHLRDLQFGTADEQLLELPLSEAAGTLFVGVAVPEETRAKMAEAAKLLAGDAKAPQGSAPSKVEQTPDGGDAPLKVDKKAAPPGIGGVGSPREDSTAQGSGPASATPPVAAAATPQSIASSASALPTPVLHSGGAVTPLTLTTSDDSHGSSGMKAVRASDDASATNSAALPSNKPVGKGPSDTLPSAFSLGLGGALGSVAGVFRNTTVAEQTTATDELLKMRARPQTGPGTVSLMIFEGDNLAIKNEKTQTSDSCVFVSSINGVACKKKLRTKVVGKTVFPQWNEMLKFEVPLVERWEVQLNIVDHGFGKDEPMGHVTVRGTAEPASVVWEMVIDGKGRLKVKSIAVAYCRLTWSSSTTAHFP